MTASSVGGSSWRDLRVRLLSAAVAAPVGLLCLWAGGPLWLLLTIAVAGVLASEWAGLCKTKWDAPEGLLFYAGIAFAIGDDLLVNDGIGAAMFPAALAAAFLVALYRGRNGIALAAGCLCISLAAVSLIWLRRGEASTILLLLLTVWASDSGAYLVGRWLGGPKLAPSISPGKTRTGAVGGLLAAVTVCAIAAAILPTTPLTPGLSAWTRLIVGAGLGAVFGIAAQLGDLAESAFKRRCGAKDSGRLLPGHGGLLDRLDGLMAVLPVAIVAVFVLSALWPSYVAPHPDVVGVEKSSP